jgi:hypothetical protein
VSRETRSVLYAGNGTKRGYSQSCTLKSNASTLKETT